MPCPRPIERGAADHDERRDDGRHPLVDQDAEQDRAEADEGADRQVDPAGDDEDAHPQRHDAVEAETLGDRDLGVERGRRLVETQEGDVQEADHQDDADQAVHESCASAGW